MESPVPATAACSSDWPYAMQPATVDDNRLMISPYSAVEVEHQFDMVLIKKKEKAAKNGKSDSFCNINIEPIEPPLEFQDVPTQAILTHQSVERLAEGLVDQIVCEAVAKSEKEYTLRLCCTPEPPSSRHVRPASRSSLNSRLSSSHNSLSVPAANKADDSSFITSAMSHDVLDIYNVPLDSDIYTLPVDCLKPKQSHPQRPKRQHRHHRKRRRDTPDTLSSHCVGVASTDFMSSNENCILPSIRLITDCPTEYQSNHQTPTDNKRHSLPGTSMSGCIGQSHCAEPVHMTLQEVRRFLHNLYSSASSMDPDEECRNTTESGKRFNHSVTGASDSKARAGHRDVDNNSDIRSPNENANYNNNNNNTMNNNNNSGSNDSKKHIIINSSRKQRYNKNVFSMNMKKRKSKTESDVNSLNNNNNIKNNNNINISDKSGHHDFVSNISVDEKIKKSDSSENNNGGGGSGCTKNSFSYTLKQTLCNIFRFARRSQVPAHCHHSVVTDTVLVLGVGSRGVDGGPPPFTKRALPPLPSAHGKNGDCFSIAGGGDCAEETRMSSQEADEESMSMSMSMVDFASSIEKVKDYGWYWGPISGETAEKILSNEPDGSFIVRDSSDDHYIFSLTFKLNGVVRHVRIEHDQGNFSFGSCTKFKSHTIVDFIENAVEHSRSGRYLFFLHRRPVHGPMRVQLLHPVSRFKQVQSLQHMCRFVILKVVRRDFIPRLPLPRRIIDYLNSPHYYSEHPSLPPEDQRPSSSPSLHLFSFVPPNS